MSEKVEGFEGYYVNGQKVYARCVNCKREQQEGEAVCPTCFPEEVELHRIYEEVRNGGGRA